MAGKQINVRMQQSDIDLVAQFAAEWDITPTEYIRLQATSPAADWRLRQMRVLRDQAQAFLDCPDGELEKLPNGWFKLRGERQWFWIEGVSDAG